MPIILPIHIIAGSLGLIAGFVALYSAKGAPLHRRAGTVFACVMRGPFRLARHLWRMSFALFIAAMSFFLGQAQVIPKPIRIMPLLLLPPLMVLVTMLYWVRRVRFRRTLQGSAHARALRAVSGDAA